MRGEFTIGQYKAYQESKRNGTLQKKEKENHKCNGCVWGKWQDIKFVCLLPRCLKGM